MWRSECSLCSRVVELVLSRSIEAGLNSSIAPQPLDHAGQLCGHHPFVCWTRQGEQLASVILATRINRKILSLNVIFYVDPVQLAYRSRLVSEIYLQLAHCPDDGHDGLDGVAVHDHFVLLALLFWVAIFMNDPDTDTKSKQDFRARVNIWQC